MSKHLYEITEEHRQLQTLAEEGADDMAQAIQDTFEMIQGEFNDKAIAVVQVATNMNGDISAVDAEIKRLQARKKTMENRRDSLKEYLRHNMENAGISKIECPLFTITLGKGAKMVHVDDEDKIPPEFLDIKTSVSPMKKEILAALKEDPDAVPGCHLGMSKSKLLIK